MPINQGMKEKGSDMSESKDEHLFGIVGLESYRISSIFK
jgi:hypothetical protein